MERELVELPAADGLSLDKVCCLFICADSFSASAVPTIVLFLHGIKFRCLNHYTPALTRSFQGDLDRLIVQITFTLEVVSQPSDTS